MHITCVTKFGFCNQINSPRNSPGSVLPVQLLVCVERGRTNTSFYFFTYLKETYLFKFIFYFSRRKFNRPSYKNPKKIEKLSKTKKTTPRKLIKQLQKPKKSIEE